LIPRTYYRRKRCLASKVWVIADGVRRAAVSIDVPGKPTLYLLDVYGRTWEAVSLYKGDVDRVAEPHRSELRPDPLTEAVPRNE
jgi:hypothetical protein